MVPMAPMVDSVGPMNRTGCREYSYPNASDWPRKVRLVEGEDWSRLSRPRCGRAPALRRERNILTSPADTFRLVFSGLWKRHIDPGARDLS